MRGLLWDFNVGGRYQSKRRRDARLELPLAKQVVATMLGLPEFPPHAALTVVDCRSFHGTFSGRVGLHFDAQQEYVQDKRGMGKFVDYLIDQAGLTAVSNIMWRFIAAQESTAWWRAQTCSGSLPTGWVAMWK